MQQYKFNRSQYSNQHKIAPKTASVYSIIIAKLSETGTWMDGMINNTKSKKFVLYTITIATTILLIIHLIKIPSLSYLDSSSIYTTSLAIPKKGQIYMQNYSTGILKKLTNSTYSTRVTINPKVLKKILDSGKFTVIEASSILASLTGLKSTDIKSKLDVAITKDQLLYYVLLSNIEPASIDPLRVVINIGVDKNSDYYKYELPSWVNYEDVENRGYPLNNLASSLVGYSSSTAWATDDIIKEEKCNELIENNKDAQALGYKIGLQGIEAKYCSQLYGSNGVQGLKSAKDGKDIVLTVDYNLQKKAEEITAKMIQDNTNSRGAPKNAVTLVVEVNNPDPSNNGRVVAMASYPNFNPNNYSQEFENKPNAFIDYTVDYPYEAGSVIKPIFAATIDDQYQIAKKENPGGNCENDKRLCVSPTWKFDDTCGGKKFSYATDAPPIKNYYDTCFGQGIGQKEIIRDSINTGIAEMSQYTDTQTMREYMLNRFGFGSQTSLGLYNEARGDTANLKNSDGRSINNAFTGFGQGFTATPMQIAQAYIPLLSGGISYPLKVVEDKTLQAQVEPKRIITEEAAAQVKGYLLATSNEGNRGSGVKLKLDGYLTGSKTGTAQIARSEVQKDANGNVITDENGKPKTIFCGYDCNSEKGLYEFTLIGFAPANNPRYIILTKMSEPRPYESSMLSTYQTVRQPWIEMAQYTMDYMQVPREF